MYGGPTVKRTALSGAVDTLEEHDGVRCDGFHKHERSIGIENGVHLSRRLAAYPSGLCEAISRMLVITLTRFWQSGSGPTGWMRSSAPATRVSCWSASVSPTRDTAVAILNELAARGRSVVIENGQAGFYLHVDDGLAIADHYDGIADAIIETGADALEAVGFDVPERLTDGELMKTIGYEPERNPARFRLPAERGALLQQALRHTASLATVDTGVLRGLVGVWTWAALLRRDLLCITSCIHKFLGKFEKVVVPWWASARREVCCMATAVNYMYADVGAPIAPVLFASDAMGHDDSNTDGDCGGFGIVARDLVQQDINHCFEIGRKPGYSVTKLSGEFSGLRRPCDDIRRRVPLSRLPWRILDPDSSAWEAVSRDRKSVV
jgi:hypothetical protein